MNIQNMIAEYAHLVAGMEYESARGRTPPAHIQDRAAMLYAKAGAMLTPAEQQQALVAVDSMKAQFLQQRAVQDAGRDARELDFQSNKLSQETTGYSVDQRAAAIRGQKIPVRGAGMRVDDEKLRVGNFVGHHAKQFGGKDVDWKKINHIADIYTEKRDARGPEAALKYLARHFDDPEGAKNLVEGFVQSDMSYIVELQEKRGGHEPDHYHTPSDDEMRRLQIAETFGENATKNPDDREAFMTDSGIDPAYLNSESDSQRDVARAFAAHEEIAENIDRQNWEGVHYDEDELAASEEED